MRFTSLFSPKAWFYASDDFEMNFVMKKYVGPIVHEFIAFRHANQRGLQRKAFQGSVMNESSPLCRFPALSKSRIKDIINR